MKYEPVFGDQSLFDGAPEEATHATKGGGFYKIENMSAKYVSDGIFNGADVLSVSGNLIAERRIIAEPNRWTVEDKKAGRLPEVGCEVILRITGEIATVNAANKNRVCLTFSDGGFSLFNVERIDPIETPEEKAQREEDEFVDSLKSVEINSGTVRSFFAQGARAAYRKLKGGE